MYYLYCKNKEKVVIGETDSEDFSLDRLVLADYSPIPAQKVLQAQVVVRGATIHPGPLLI